MEISNTLTASVAGASADPAPQSGTEDGVESLALQWFTRMRTGQIDRTRLVAEYNTHLTDDAVQRMSRFLTAHHYGVEPTRAQILQTRSIGEQTFHVVKLVFPRGDAASLMFGFNADGKITGVSLMGMAGD
jgi:hypothetical protein